MFEYQVPEFEYQVHGFTIHELNGEVADRKLTAMGNAGWSIACNAVVGDVIYYTLCKFTAQKVG